MTKRIGSRVLVSVLVALILMGLRAVTADAAVTTHSLYQGGQTPASLGGDLTQYELGVRFRVVGVASTLTGGRFWKSGSSAMTAHTMTLWNTLGTALTTCTTSSETASGWQTCTWGTPYALTPDTNYRLSYGVVDDFALTTSGLAGGRVDAPLETVGTNGLYNDTVGVAPDQTFSNTDYFVDPIVSVDDGEEPEPELVIVALSEGDQMRLDLIWIGVFLLCGITFGMTFGRAAWDEFRKWAHT